MLAFCPSRDSTLIRAPERVVRRKDFLQGNQDKVALEHAWVRQDEFGSGNVEVIVEEQVDVDGAVVIDATCRLDGASKFALYLLRPLKTLKGSEFRLNQTCGVEEGMLAAEAPWLCLDEGRDTLHRTDALADKLDGALQQPVPTPEIRPKRQVQFVVSAFSH